MSDSKARILVVDDNLHNLKLLKDVLMAHDYQVHFATNGTDALLSVQAEPPDLILLDVKMPDIDGYEVCQRLKSNPSHQDIPVIFITVRDKLSDKMKAFSIGGVDYLTKPFDKAELMARIQAIVRRSKGHAQSIIRTGRLSVNLDAHTVEVDGHPVHLTGKEYGILELLSLRKGTTLTKEMFLNHLYGGMDEPELKIIDVFICKLRKKLSNAAAGENYIETIWGRGYVLREPEGSEEVELKAAKG